MRTAQDLMNKLSPEAMEGLGRAPEIAVAVPAEEPIIDNQANAQVSASESQAEENIPSSTEGTAAPQKSIHSHNFRELKNQAEKIARERDEAVRMVKELQSAKQYQQHSQPVAEEDIDFSLAPDELAEGKHLSKLIKQVKRVEEKLERYNKQQAMMTVETRLNQEFPDFNKVVTKENVTTLSMTYPEIASAISASPDTYAQSKAVYTLIKQFGLVSEDEPVNQAQEIIKRNLAKPKVGASVSAQNGGTNPVGRSSDYYSGDLTDEMKKSFYQELLNAKMARR